MSGMPAIIAEMSDIGGGEPSTYSSARSVPTTKPTVPGAHGNADPALGLSAVNHSESGSS